MLKDKRAVVPLIRLLEDEKTKVRIAAIKALALIGDERAAGPLSRCLKDINIKVKTEAVNALVKFGGEEAPKALKESLSDPDIRETIDWAIKRIESKDKKTGIVEIL